MAGLGAEPSFLSCLFSALSLAVRVQNFSPGTQPDMKNPTSSSSGLDLSWTEEGLSLPVREPEKILFG